MFIPEEKQRALCFAPSRLARMASTEFLLGFPYRPYNGSLSTSSGPDMTNVAAVVMAGIIPELQSHSFLNCKKKPRPKLKIYSSGQSL